MVVLLNVRRCHVPDPGKPAGPMRPGQCATCQECGREAKVAHADTPRGTAKDARGTARRQLVADCPHPARVHLTTPVPPGLRLEFAFRGRTLPLYVTRSWDLASAGGRVPDAVEVVVRPVEGTAAARAAAEAFAGKLRGHGYLNAVARNRPVRKGAKSS